MNKLLLTSVLFSVALSGCKTIESVQKDLGSITAGLTGEEATPEQIQAAYIKAEEAFQEALTAYNLIESESLADYDKERVAEAQKIWQVLEPEFEELRLSPGNALESASLFSSDTVADEVMEQSLEVIQLVSAASLAKDRITAVLKPVRDEFVILDKLDTKQNFDNRYAELDKHHEQLKEWLIEGDEQKVVEYVPQMLEKMTALEKDAVVQFYFSTHIDDIYKLANSNKVDRFPAVYSDIKNQLEQGQTYTQQNYRDYDNIQKQADLVGNQIKRINSLYAQYTTMKTAIDDDKVEAELLEFEQQLQSLTKAAGLGDLRHLSFAEQLQQVKNTL